MSFLQKSSDTQISSNKMLLKIGLMMFIATIGIMLEN